MYNFKVLGLSPLSFGQVLTGKIGAKEVLNLQNTMLKQAIAPTRFSGLCCRHQFVVPPVPYLDAEKTSGLMVEGIALSLDMSQLCSFPIPPQQNKRCTSFPYLL